MVSFSDHEDHEGGDAAPHERGEHAVGLDRNLGEVALEQTGRAADRLDREHAGQESADDAADGVDAEDVEAVVIAEELLQARRGRCSSRRRQPRR